MQSHISSSAPSKREYRGGHRVFDRAAGTLPLVCGVGAFVAGIFLAGLDTFALTAPVLENLNNASNLAWGPTPQTSIGIIVANIVLAILGLLGVLFVVLLTYGGFLWFSSAGEEDKVKKAQGLIINAVIGALIVVAAYSVAYYVLRKLGEAVGGT
ncbi:hypothetical protein HY732_03065 [Candidatus Uhrbacteria bacterium]|nr:hypothetical protein [Candidatus Uhrbacteria bacterium]